MASGNGRPASAGPGPARGWRERGSSDWLGQAAMPGPVFERYRHLDRQLLSSVSLVTGGLSPATLAAAFSDWWVHLWASPAKQLELIQLAATAWAQAAMPAATDPAVVPLAQDKRFPAPPWQGWPFNAYAQSFLQLQDWWQHATHGVPGVARRHEAMVGFGARQWLDMAAPSNGVFTNPVVLQRTLAEGGANLQRGAWHAADDVVRALLDLPPAGAEAFVIGKNIAVTAGQVVMRNRLAELIQYAPTTPRTHREPVLLVPAWIMKYYILDLSPPNSLVKALVDQGFTVFIISWKNPTAADRELGLADYFHLGVEAALDTIAEVLPATPVHALGYCLGGTLMAMAAAALARRRPQALASLTLLAAQTDFSDPGELGLFMDAGQIEMLDDLMWRQGVLQARQMASSFQMLRSQDLVWSHWVVEHLLGERRPFTDLMAWNADGTRMPYRMHSEYLHSLFLDNALARGQMRLDGPLLKLTDIGVPIFNVGAVQDHVAPWRSVFKLHALTDAEQTFVLTAGGHNVGIVNPPRAAPTSHRLRVWHTGEHLLSADEWLATTAPTEGSWWTPWFDWLRRHSTGERKAPLPRATRPGQRRSLGPAPGHYVFER